MKSFLIIFLTLLFGILLFPTSSSAIEDPLSLPNNKIGVHILFPDELDKASRLVNSGGADWGYVTIPIQAGDRDLEKWQKFMDSAKQNQVIPIMRLATEGDYFNTTVWRKPAKEDVLDFANFVNSLNWPVKNRYIVVFNEVNRSDEWEGSLNPQEYAEILNYATEVFKSLSSDFFIISAGLDNAAPNVYGKYMNEYDYMIEMNDAVPGIFGLIDGLGSHAYPNPGFSQNPSLITKQNISSFRFERNLTYQLSGKNLPVFITETGWSKDALSEHQIANYFKYAFEYVWTDKDIVAITPFLLQAGTRPFSQFSLINTDGNESEIFLALEKFVKTEGKPTVNREETILSENMDAKNLPVKSFLKRIRHENSPWEKSEGVENVFKWFLKLSV